MNVRELLNYLKQGYTNMNNLNPFNQDQDVPFYSVCYDAITIQISNVHLLITNAGVCANVGGIETIRNHYTDMRGINVTLYTNPMNNYVQAIYLEVTDNTVHYKIITPTGTMIIGQDSNGGYYYTPDMHAALTQPTLVDAFSRYIGASVRNSKVHIADTTLSESGSNWSNLVGNLLETPVGKTITVGDYRIVITVSADFSILLDNKGIHCTQCGRVINTTSQELQVYYSGGVSITGRAIQNGDAITITYGNQGGILIINDGWGNWTINKIDGYGNRTTPQTLATATFNSFDDFSDSFIQGLKSTDLLTVFKESEVIAKASPLDDLPVDDTDPSFVTNDPTALEWWDAKIAVLDLPDGWLAKPPTMTKSRGKEAYKVTIEITR